MEVRPSSRQGWLSTVETGIAADGNLSGVVNHFYEQRSALTKGGAPMDIYGVGCHADTGCQFVAILRRGLVVTKDRDNGIGFTIHTRA